jgi:hypothetical protein
MEQSLGQSGRGRDCLSRREVVIAAGTPEGLTTLALVSYGVPVRIGVSDASLLERLPEHFPPGWKRARSTAAEEEFSVVRARSKQRRAVWRLFRGGERIAQAASARDLLKHLESWLRLTIAIRSPQRIFVHAGVVGWRGRALLLPGRSHSGKTTLVAALVRAGATYFSDEYAVLDDTGRVHPFAKPLSIRGPDGGAARKYPVEALGGRAATRPLPVGLVAVTRYRAGARWRPRTLSPAEGLFALLSNTPTALTRSEDALRTLNRVVLNAVTLRGARAEADRIAPLLLERLGKA